MKKSICFAYFADGNFIGWYGDSFGSITKTPKLYSNVESAVETVTKNFQHKMKRIKESSFDQEKDTVTNIVAAISLGVFSGEEDLRGKEVELRVVECPIYDGPDPDFDKEKYEREKAEYKEKMTAAGVFDIPAPSIERMNAIKNFEAKNPRPVCNNWIYADFSLVKEWAQNEPTEFIKIIKSE